MTDETMTDDPVAALMAERGRGAAQPAQRRLRGLDAAGRAGCSAAGRARPSAVVRDVDRDGVLVVITDADGEHTGRIEFAEQVTDPMALTGAPARARAARPGGVGRGGRDERRAGDGRARTHPHVPHDGGAGRGRPPAPAAHHVRRW